jgi:hypothetical protein
MHFSEEPNMKIFEPIVAPRDLTLDEQIRHCIARFGAIPEYEEAALAQLDDAWQGLDNAVDVFITLCIPGVLEELLCSISLHHRCNIISQQLQGCACTRRRTEEMTKEIVWLAQERDRILADCALESACLWQVTELAVRCRDTHKRMHHLMGETFPEFAEFGKLVEAARPQSRPA